MPRPAPRRRPLTAAVGAATADARRRRPVRAAGRPAAAERAVPSADRRRDARGNSARLRGPCHPPNRGAPAVRPADVERWFAELGLEPARTSRPRWDRQLGSRPRRPPPLRSPRDGHPRPGAGASSAGRTTRRRSTTCSASRTASCCAGTTSSRSPSSAVGEDERPLLAVELPIEAADGRRARAGARPDRRHRRPAARRDRSDWLWIGGRDAGPGRAGRRATRRCSTGTPTACPSSSGVSRRTRAGCAVGSVPLVLAFAGRRPVWLAAPAGAPRSARRCPTSRSSRCPLRRPARRAARPRHGRPDAARTTCATPRPGASTSTARSSPSCPARTGFRLSWDGPARRRPRVYADDQGLHAAAARPRAAAVQRQVGDLPARLRPASTRAARPRATSASATSLVSFPVWAFATDDTPGSTVKVVFPTGYQVEVEAGEIPEPTTDAERDGRSSARAASTSRSRSSPTSSATGRAPTRSSDGQRRPSATTPVDLEIRAWPDDPAWARARRRSGRARRCRSLGDTDRAAAGRATAGSRSRRPSAGRRAAMPGCSIRPGPGRGRVLRRRLRGPPRGAHAWFNGALLADRWANEAFASYYGLQAAADARGQGDRRRADADELRGTDPAQRLGRPRPRATRPRTTPTRLRSPRPSTSPSGPGADGLHRSGRTPRRDRRLPAARPAAPRGRRRAEAETVDRTARLARPAGPARGADRRDYDDLWRDLGRPADATSLLDWTARPRAPDTRRSWRARGWDLPEAVRDAMRAWQFEAATDLLDQAAASSPARRRSRRPRRRGPDAAGQPPDCLRAPRRLRRRRGAGRRPSSRRSPGTTPRSRRRPAEPDPLQVLGLWETTPEADLGPRSGDLCRRRRPVSATAADARGRHCGGRRVRRRSGPVAVGIVQP